jgi:hypothetical protein
MAYCVDPLASLGEDRRRARRVGGGDDHDHADAAVEDAAHLVDRHVAGTPQPSEDGRQVPGRGVDLDRHVVRNDARHVFHEAAAGDMRHGLGETGTAKRERAAHIDARRRQQRLGEAAFRREGRGGVPGKPGIRDDAADQRKSVRMHARGREAEHDVAGGDAASVDDCSPLDGTDREPREVVVAAGVHAGHLGGFAANQGAT